MTTFTAIILKEEEVFVASCPQVGTASQGDTVEQALANLKEATELYLQEHKKDFSDRDPPIMATFEVAELAKA